MTDLPPGAETLMGADTAVEHFIGDRTNATFYYFTDSGKYYSHGRGVCPESVFQPLGVAHETRIKLLLANANAMPGLPITDANFRTVVILDENVDFGWPIYLHPEHLK